jgi:hypothetical protein
MYMSLVPSLYYWLWNVGVRTQSKLYLHSHEYINIPHLPVQLQSTDTHTWPDNDNYGLFLWAFAQLSCFLFVGRTQRFIALSWKAETTFHYCWEVKSSFKLVWMESTSPPPATHWLATRLRGAAAHWSDQNLFEKIQFWPPVCNRITIVFSRVK